MGPQDWLKRIFIMQKKGEDVGNTLDFQTSTQIGEDGFNGIERDQAPFHPGRIIFWETPLGSQSFESCSLLIENMATFGTDAD